MRVQSCATNAGRTDPVHRVAFTVDDQTACFLVAEHIAVILGAVVGRFAGQVPCVDDFQLVGIEVGDVIFHFDAVTPVTQRPDLANGLTPPVIGFGQQFETLLQQSDLLVESFDRPGWGQVVQFDCVDVGVDGSKRLLIYRRGFRHIRHVWGVGDIRVGVRAARGAFESIEPFPLDVVLRQVPLHVGDVDRRVLVILVLDL